jgi:UDPglucose 6-dehydrogenase
LVLGTDPALLAACPLVILSRDIPTDADNTSNLAGVEGLVESVIPHLRADATLVIMSQVPPGFTRARATRIHQQRPGEPIRVHYWVETLVVGQAVNRYLHPERIIVGCADPTAPLPAALAHGLARFGCPILPMRYESAELTKTAINLYLASSVTYANTLADLCERIDADWSEVVPALRLDARIGPAAYIRPGLGISGGNIERDLVTLRNLARAKGTDATFIDTIMDHNARRYRWLQDKLQHLVFTDSRVPTVALWGLAYKKNSRSTKNAVSLRVIADLQGRALLRAYDPLVSSLPGNGGASLVARDESLEGADCLLILTDWDEFATADAQLLRKAMRRPLIIDCVGILEARRGMLQGIEYVSMGRDDAP